jgi:molybdate transport system regulatory protein
MAASNIGDTYSVKGRIWVEVHHEALMGAGKVQLLKKTAELGSLRKAASEMNISYRKAWYSLNQMNKTADTPLIILKRGGKHGGTAEITELGELLLGKFEKMEEEFIAFLVAQTKFINS